MGRANGLDQSLQAQAREATPEWARPLTDKEKELISNVKLAGQLIGQANLDVLGEQVTDVLMQAANGTPEGVLQELRHLRNVLDEIHAKLEPFERAEREARKVISNRLGRR